jgi:hypothetical protein
MISMYALHYMLTLTGREMLNICTVHTQVMGFFNPSTRRHYLGLFLLLVLILLHVSVVRLSSGRNMLLARITQLTTDPS